MVNKTNFAKFIKKKRMEKQLTQEQLAEALCISVTAVSKWERGVTYPDITLIAPICAALGVSEHEFITACDDVWLTQFLHKFNVRTQGLLLQNGCILLQTDVSEPTEYALPGGQIRFGETAAEALARRFQQETGAAVAVRELAWTEENFCTYRGQEFQQVALTFHMHMADALPQEGFPGTQEHASHLRFHWLPVERLSEITVYPQQLHELLREEKKHVVRRNWAQHVE